MRSRTRLTSRALALAALLSPVWAMAQVTVNGQPYEAAAWGNPTAMGSGPVNGTWTGGSVTASGTSFAPVQTAGGSPSFAGSTVWAVTAAAFTPDMGSINDANATVDGDMRMTVKLTPAALPAPTEVLFYAGAPGSGMKSTIWSWAAADTATTFELVNNTNFTTVTQTAGEPARLSGNGTSALVWRSYNPSFTNNQAQAVVRIRNPNGITGFTITTNRLVIASGQLYDTPSQTQASDFSDMAILLRPRPAAIADNATTPSATPVTVAVQNNDTVPAAVQVSGIDLDPDTPGTQTQRVVAGQGTFNVVDVGGALQVRFTPVAGFAGISTIGYVLLTANGDQSTEAALAVTVSAMATSGGINAVPTLSQWALAAMALLLGWLAWRRRARSSARRS